MFDALLDIRHRGGRHRTGAAVSIVAHAVVVAAAIGATRIEPPLATKPERPDEFIYPWRPKPQPTAPAETQSPAPPLPPLAPAMPVLVGPVEIPAGLPPIDPAALPAPDSYTGARSLGTPGGDSSSRVPTSGLASHVYDSGSVDKPAMQIAGAGVPEYPGLLRSAGVEGEVVAAFVVDTTGRADIGTLRLLRSTRPEFADAVRRSLPQARFLPAEVVGRKVRQLVELPYVFSIRK